MLLLLLLSLDNVPVAGTTARCSNHSRNGGGGGGGGDFRSRSSSSFGLPPAVAPSRPRA